jgi:site-specific DNA recombinase
MSRKPPAPSQSVRGALFVPARTPNAIICLTAEPLAPITETAMPQRVLSYQRYSSDNQSDASIEDQRRLCRAWIAREGAEIAGEYADHAYSGATLLRPGYQALIADVLAGKADIVLTESLDRISRDQEHLAAFFKQCEFAGVRVISLSDGEVGPLHISMRGVMGSMFLRDLSDKTRRGVEGRILKGRSHGAPPYGIRVVHKLTVTGELDTGLREVDPDKAAIVERIFREYAAGKSPLRIAHELNEAGIPGPSGKKWHQATIRGRPTRADGLLRNRAYIGDIIWNRRRNVRDPISGKTLRRLNPADKLTHGKAPELRIIDDALWHEVQARLASEALPPRDSKIEGTVTQGFWAGRRVLLLTGKIFCGVCGGPVSASGGRYLGCDTARHHGCSNRRTHLRTKLEAAVLETFASRFMQTDALEGFIQTVTSEFKRLVKELTAGQESQRRELAQVERQLGNLMERILDGLSGVTVQKTLNDLESRRDRLVAQLAQSSEQLPTLNVDLARTYQEYVQKLHHAVHDKSNPDLLEAARGMIERVTIFPGREKGNPPELEIVGSLTNMLTAAGAKIPPTAANDLGDQSVTALSLKAAAGGSVPWRGPGAEPLAFTPQPGSPATSAPDTPCGTCLAVAAPVQANR